MNHRELIKEISNESGFKESDSRLMINCFIDIVFKELSTGGHVEVKGFGKFYRKFHMPTEKRRIDTGEKYFLDGRMLPKFRAGAKFKRIVT